MTKMQTDAADAPNSQQILQDWINKNQINKKTNRISNTFFRKIPVKKAEEKHKRGKIHNTGKYGREGQWKRKGSTLEEGPRTGMFNRILGREVRDEHGKYRQVREKEIQEGKEVHGKKGQR